MYFIGMFGHSIAMLSDDIHSLSEVLSTIVISIKIKVSNKYNLDNLETKYKNLKHCIILVNPYGGSYER